MSDQALRHQLSRALAWRDAHAPFERAVKGLSPELRGRRPPGAPHSPWELLEHLRITQFDILDFCRDPAYVEPHWPDDYWPGSPEPPDGAAWDESVGKYLRDRRELDRLANDPEIDLFAAIPHGTGQTYLRELLLVIDHGAYHIGQLILIRRLLGAWPPPE